MKCRRCESKNIIGKSSLDLVDCTCLDCGKNFLANMKTFSYENDLNYLCGCIGINNHTIYNNIGKEIKIEL